MSRAGDETPTFHKKIAPRRFHWKVVPLVILDMIETLLMDASATVGVLALIAAQDYEQDRSDLANRNAFGAQIESLSDGSWELVQVEDEDEDDWDDEDEDDEDLEEVDDGED